MIRRYRAIIVAILGGVAVGIWTAAVPGSWLPLLGLAALAGATGWAMAQSPIAVFAATTTALSGVAGRSFGYAGTGPTEVWELVVPMLPVLAGVACLAYKRSSATADEILEHVRSHWPLWGLAAWGMATTLWATRPIVALLVSTSWAVILLSVAASRANVWTPMQGFISGCWVFLVASNVRASFEPVDRPSGGRGLALLPVDKIVGFAEDTTELADIAVAAAFASLLLPSRVGRSFGFLFAAGTVFRTDQRAGIVALGVGVLALGLLARRAATRAVAASLLAAAMAAGAFAVAADALDRTTLSRTDSGDDVASLSGRTEIWATAWADRTSWVVLGDGPGAGEEAAQSAFGHLTINMHNRPLQLAITLGAVGLALSAAALARIGRRWRALPVPLLAATAAILASGLAVPGFGGVGPTPPMLALTLTALAAGSVKQSAQAHVVNERPVFAHPKGE